MEIIKLNKGDVIFFSTLLMHRSLECKNLRLASPILIKNFKDNTYSFENNRNWTIFSYSEITKIERILGNHYLSPFRIWLFIVINSNSYENFYYEKLYFLMDLHSKMTMYITNKMTSPVTKAAKSQNGLGLKHKTFKDIQYRINFPHPKWKLHSTKVTLQHR